MAKAHRMTVINDQEKPHKGRIKFWTSQVQQSDVSPDINGKTIIIGFYADHPDFKDQWGHTSWLVSMGEPNQFGYREIETKNSRYTLVGHGLTWENYVKFRQAYESGKHAQAYRSLNPSGPGTADVQTAPKQQERSSKKDAKPYYSRTTKAIPASRDRAK